MILKKKVDPVADPRNQSQEGNFNLRARSRMHTLVSSGL